MAITLDTIVIGAFGAINRQSDRRIVFITLVAVVVVFAFERIYLSRWTAKGGHGGH